MAAKAIAQPEIQVREDEIMSWRASVALWMGLAALGWMSVAAAIATLF